MNIYMLMEGEETEPRLYPAWLKLIAPNMEQVFFIERVVKNNFYSISGRGYPSLLAGQLLKTIKDINDFPVFDQLWVILDTDDCTVAEREQEVYDKINDILINHSHLSLGTCQVHVIAQQVCIETWGLANKRVFPHHKITGDLREFYDHYDVSLDDPELMQKPTAFGCSIGEYHHRYLKTMLKTRNESLRYTKKSPSPLDKDIYFKEIVKRVLDDGHVNSFRKFYDLALALNT